MWNPSCEGLLRAFIRRDVEYLLIGSMAKSHYRPQSHVNDMDLMVSSTRENAERVERVLRHDMGECVTVADLPEDLAERLATRDMQLCLFKQHGVVPVHVITPKGFDFRRAYSRSTEEWIRWCSMLVRVASMSDLEILDSLR